ncbi:MAG: hypothetical protein ACKV0T_05325 [Planctomycetales bacterium]
MSVGGTRDEITREAAAAPAKAPTSGQATAPPLMYPPSNTAAPPQRIAPPRATAGAPDDGERFCNQSSGIQVAANNSPDARHNATGALPAPSVGWPDRWTDPKSNVGGTVAIQTPRNIQRRAGLPESKPSHVPQRVMKWPSVPGGRSSR